MYNCEQKKGQGPIRQVDVGSATQINGTRRLANLLPNSL